MKTTVPAIIGGTKVAIAWPNMWLSGNKLRNRSGKNGRPYFLYFSTSRSTGTMLASTLRCVSTTPLGSAVAPDVKMISATSSRVTATTAGVPGFFQSTSLRRQTAGLKSGTTAGPISVALAFRPAGSTSSPNSSSLASTM